MLDSRATAVLGADVNRLLRQLQKAPKVTIGTRIVGTLLMRMDVFEAHATSRCPGTTVDRDGNYATVDQLISRTMHDFERFREQKKTQQKNFRRKFFVWLAFFCVLSSRFQMGSTTGVG